MKKGTKGEVLLRCREKYFLLLAIVSDKASNKDRKNNSSLYIFDKVFCLLKQNYWF